MTHIEDFNRHGAIYIKDVISKDLSMFLTHCLMRASYYQSGRLDDEQVPGAQGILDHEVLMETLQERLWIAVEAILQEELIPTYSYSRLYVNGNELKKHSDRPACEISLTVQLGRSHHYCWPIFMGGKRYDLAEGDGVIYKGCEIDHWRGACDGPEGYYSGQAFFHFVRKNGPHYREAFDRRWSENQTPFIRYRQHFMETK